MLLAAPRRSSASANRAGDLAVYTVSTYSFESHKKTTEIKVLDIRTGLSTVITNEEGCNQPNWLGEGNELLWLEPGENGITKLIVGSVEEIGRSYVAGVVPASVSDVKLKQLDQDRIAIAVTGKAKPDGSFYRPEDEPIKYSSGKIYDSMIVRDWDTYLTPNKNAIWHGILHRAKPHTTTSKGIYSLGGLTNLLKGSGLESPIPAFGGKDHFDLSATSVGFVAKDPIMDPSLNTKSNFYLVTIKDTSDGLSYSEPIAMAVEGFEGASTAPVFSPTGKGVAFLQMKENGYESDKNRIIINPDIGWPFKLFEVLSSPDGKGLWDISPSSLSFSNDGKTLFVVAEEKGVEKLFKLELSGDGPETNGLPQPLTHSGSISDVVPLGSDSSKLLLSGSNLIDNSFYSILDPSDSVEARVISSNSRNGSSFGLSQDQVSDIWFEGVERIVHAWVMKPSNFSSSTKYPLAYLVHGGPQAAWTDSWSTRWNPAVFAEMGYVVVLPNPTGSTSYGQAFVDAIAENWGGSPYDDLVKGFEYIRENMTFVDTDRAVALGASYGGYMMNWIQGHSLAEEFKALVCHDGVFSMVNQQASDEQFFPVREMGGFYWETQETWDKWSPSPYTANWSTPMLVIHSELDYRLPISEGLAAFNVLQMRGVESQFLTFPDEYVS